MRLWACLILAACDPSFPENLPGLRITDGELGAHHANNSVDYAMPFVLARDGMPSRRTKTTDITFTQMMR